VEITNENLVVLTGGHKTAGLGAQIHFPVFKDDEGTEYVSTDGQTLRKISSLSFQNTRREIVQR
jgi:hypothetical protein